MNITTNDDWTWEGDSFARAYATTDDPRVLAVIERDDERSISSLLDGDAIPSIYGVEYCGHWQADSIAGFGDDGDLAQRVLDARARFRGAAGYQYDGLSGDMIMKSEAMLTRWLWIFHRAAVTFTGYQGEDFMVLCSRDYQDHIDWTHVAREDAQEAADVTAGEVDKICEGEVFGIGYAENEGRRLDEPFDTDDLDTEWTVSIECWGLIGEDYAKSEAATFTYGDPGLPEMLPVYDEPGFIEHTDWLAERDIRESSSSVSGEW